MWKAWLALLSALMGLGLAQAPTPVLAARAAMVILWEDGAFKCSGFAIAVNLVITAAHCVTDTTKAHAVSRVDAPLERYPARVLARRYDALSDQATLRLEAAPPLTPISRCPSLPEAGQRLWIWGSPLGLATLLRTGIHSGRLESWKEHLLNRAYGKAYATDINIDQGASGAAVLTDAGCYVGLVTSRWNPTLKLDGAIWKQVW